nr:AMP-binding protein [uncultured Shimia sp.]
MNRIHTLIETAAQMSPEKMCMEAPNGEKITWNHLWQAVKQAADDLGTQNVKAGDRVVIVSENCAEAVVYFFATSLLDAMAVMVNARLTPIELDRIISHADPSAVVFTTSISDAATEHAQARGAATIPGETGDVAVLAKSGSMPESVYQDPAEQVALLLYTSGTTGAPKAAMLTHKNLLSAAKAAATLRGIVPTDVVYLALPLSHIFGLIALLSVCFARSSMRLEAGFSVQRLYNALQVDVTVLPAVPQMHAHLFHYARAHDMPQFAGGPLRFVSSGGAPLDPVWKREAEAFYGLPLQNGYGLTECAAGVCATLNELGDPDISVGRPMLDSVLQIDLDANGAHADQGIGEILVGGPQVMKGYFRDPTQTDSALTSEGFFRTGDLGRIDPEGRLHIVGRTKELIIRSGFNVYPVEIEATLTEHPDVIVAGVVGRATDGNEEVLAFVKVDRDSSLDEATLKAFVQERLAPYKRPTRIILAHDLPAAPTGKILKAKLIETFMDQLEEHG